MYHIRRDSDNPNVSHSSRIRLPHSNDSKRVEMRGLRIPLRAVSLVLLGLSIISGQPTRSRRGVRHHEPDLVEASLRLTFTNAQNVIAYIEIF